MANSISGLNKTIKTANNRKIKDLTPVSTLPTETVRELPRPPEKQPAVIVPPTAPGAQRTVTGSAAPAQTTQAGPSGTSGGSSTYTMGLPLAWRTSIRRKLIIIV